MHQVRKIDVRDLDPINRYPTVAETFENLKTGEQLELTNDHDLQHLLKYKFALDYPEEYDYRYLLQGPELWRVTITKR